MKLELQCGDRIAIPTGCKATVSEGYVLFERKETYKKGDFVYAVGCVFILSKVAGGELHFDVGVNLISNKVGFESDFGIEENFRYATEDEQRQTIEALRVIGKDWDFEKQEIVDWEWRPKIGDNYFIIDPEDGSGVMELSYDNDSIDNINLKIGIAFRTRELAEAAIGTLKQCKHY